MKSLVSRQCLLATGGLRDAQPDRPSDFPIVLYAQRQLPLAVGFSRDEQAHRGSVNPTRSFGVLQAPLGRFHMSSVRRRLGQFNGYSS